MKPAEPRDMMGNLLVKDGFVTVHFNTVPIFKIIALESGGLHTAQGVTPALVRVICDMTLRQMPGVPFSSLARIVSPGTEQLLEEIGKTLTTT